METSIVTGLFTILGTIAGAIVTALIEKNKKKENRIHKSLFRCANQIKAYFYLEKAYMDTLHNLTGESSQKIQIRMRDKVQKENGIRPDMTVSDANTYLEMLDF